MTAAWLRWFLLALGLAAAAWAWVWWQAGHHGVAVIGSLCLLMLHAPVLAIECLLVHRVNRRDPAPRATWRELGSACWAEVKLGVKVFAWWQPWRASAVPDGIEQVEASSTQVRAVVLVHGFMCNRGMWNAWMRRLRAQGLPYVAVNLEPTFGDIDDYAAIVEQAVLRARAATGHEPVVVAHSMGGLAVRAWLRSWSAQPSHAGLSRPVHRVITLGTPHHGTLIGRWNPLPNVVQMRRESAWLGALGRSHSAELSKAFVCFYSHCDNVVFPATTATLPGADNRHLRGVAHMQLIEHPAVWQAVQDAIHA